MPLPVNSNIASLNAQRNLQRSTAQLNKSLERLSSGLRINRAGDDAAGLSISEGLRSQIRGINQAVRNSNDGLSLIGTAESAIGAYTDTLQRIRELAVQSANDTNSPANRRALEEERSQLLEEMERISSTIEFNGTKLLNGTFTGKQLQVGANVGDTILITTGDLRTSQVGAVAVANGTPITAALGSGDLILNAIQIPASTSDGVSFAAQAQSAIAIANAINSETGATEVFAEAQSTIVLGTDSTIGVVSIDGDAGAGQSITINGINIGALQVQASDADSALRDAINNSTNTTGVTATLNGNRLELTAADGRNITVTTTGSIADELGFAALDGDISTTFSGTIKLSSDAAFSISGTSPTSVGLTAGTEVIDLTTAINRTSVSTVQGANDTIRTMDNALRQVNQTRSTMGAITNRLEITIQNLQATAENLAASDSRIRDADFAAETANLTKNQILQQAGISILSQANVTTQSALTLLQQ